MILWKKNYFLKEKRTPYAINLKEFSPEGAKLDIMVAGKVSGKVTGQIMTTHNALMKPDGTGNADVKVNDFQQRRGNHGNGKG